MNFVYIILLVISQIKISLCSSTTDVINLSSDYTFENKIKLRKNFHKRRKIATTNINKNFNDNIDSDKDNNISQYTTNFIAECDMPTNIGKFRMRAYTYNSPNIYLEPIVMISGDVKDKENVIVRVHDQCFTSEVFGSKRCDCSEQLQESLKLIHEKNGIVIYLQQEGRGIGIANKVAAYRLQDQGFDTIDANLHLGFKDEMREYQCVPEILKDLNIKSIQILTNNPFKINELSKLGVNITDRISLVVPPNQHNLKYLSSKRLRMNHLLPDNSDIVNKFRGGSSINSNILESNLLNKLSGGNDNEYALGKSTVLDAIEAIKQGKIVIVVDDENRENEGDFIMAAEKATPESIGFFVRHTSGVICISLEGERLDYLKLPPMVINNEDPKQTAYSVSVDYKHNTSTGISSSDRSACFRALVDPSSKPEDFTRPGHVFPLRYKSGGVLERAGHTEASIDLCKLAGLKAGGVLAEVVNDDGSLKRLPDLITMANEYNLVITSVQDIIAYRKELLEQKR